MSLSLAKDVLFLLFYTARISTQISRFKILFSFQGQQFTSSIGLMQVKFRNILLRLVARRHASHKHKHIRYSDTLTRHVCSCTSICICSDTLPVVNTQTWFPSRFGDQPRLTFKQNYICSLDTHMVLIKGLFCSKRN